MIRVLISDDHAILRRGLKEILMHEFQDAVCGEAENAQQALAQVESQHWDLVILDVTMPGPSGIDVLRNLKRTRPKLPVLVLSIHPEDQYGKRVLRAGASGYMNKDVAPDELIKAVRKVLAGGRYVSAGLAEKLVLELGEESERPAHETLSDREFEVLRMITSGKMVSAIADELHLSVTTVSNRMKVIYMSGYTPEASVDQGVLDPSVLVHRQAVHGAWPGVEGPRSADKLMQYGLRNHLVE